MDNRNAPGGLASDRQFHDPRLEALDPEASSIWGATTGLRGGHTAVAILARDPEGAARTLESLRSSVPGFAGEVLVGCALSDTASLQPLLASQPFPARAVEVPAGSAAAARNRLVAEASRPWVLLLESVSFAGDPFPALQAEAARLGCKFLGLPVRDADGRATFQNAGAIPFASAAVLTVARDDVPGTEGPGFLCTWIRGDALAVERGTLLAAGGWDESLAGGLEDLELSVRVFRAGVKVGHVGAAALVRDGPEPRVDVASVRATLPCFVAKHDLRVRLPPRPSPRGPRPRIALVTDTDSWAFASIARQLVRHLSDRYEFQVIPIGDRECADQVLLAAADADLVHFFWRDVLRVLGGPDSRAWVERLGLSYDAFHARYLAGKTLTTAVYDHLYLDEANARLRAPYMRSVAAYYVSSNRLDRIYRELPGYPAPAAVLPDGVDLSLFRPEHLDRFNRIGEREIVVGWAGNSGWVSEVEDFKGLHSILKPALEQLAAEGVHLRTRFADRAERFVPQSEMPAYYASIDVYVCPSKIEGTPNPVLESMACGVPVISTDVGIVPDAFGPLQSEFILKERSIACLKDALRCLASKPAAFRRLSCENLERIREWDWSRRAEGFAPFFDGALAAMRRRCG